MDLRVDLFNRIRLMNLPRGTLSALTDCHVSALSAWLNRGVPLPQEKITKIKEVVSDLEHALTYFPGVSLDLRNPDFLERLIQSVKKTEELAEADEQLEAALQEADGALKQFTW